MILKDKISLKLATLIIIALVIRIMISTLPSFEYDESAYRFWSQRLVELGPAHFYSAQVFTNNPLGGLYAFWITGLVKNAFIPHLSFFSREYDILLKLPANIADIITGFIIYLLVKRKVSERWAIIGFLMYVFNPALMFNSSIWGQYDGLSTLFLLIATYTILITKIPELSALAFATAWAIKPQTIFFAPLLMILIFLTKKPIRWITCILTFLITLSIIYLPFFPANPISGIIYVNKGSASLFNCTTCFTLNFWGIFGNWQNDMQIFIGIPLVVWGIILLLIPTIGILFLKPFSFKFKPPYFYFTTAIFIAASVMLLTRMHERYLFPFFPFLLLAAITLKSRILIYFYILMSALHLLNLYIPYTYYNNLSKIMSLPVNNLVENFNYLSLMSFLSFVLLFIYYLKHVKQS